MKCFAVSTAKLKILSDEMPERGEKVLVEAHGTECMAIFEAAVVRVGENEIEVVLTNKPKFLEPQENARVGLFDVTGTLLSQGRVSEIQAVDISTSGFGFLCDSALKRSEKIEIRLETTGGSIICTGEVRYCRPDPDQLGWYRSGMQLDELSRLERARWNRLIEEQAA